MRRRAIAVLAAVGLAATALFGVAPAASANGVPGAPYVALGDSMASGNGNLPYVDEACLRSANSYPVQVGAATGLGTVSFACTGATTLDVFDPADPTAGQVAAAVGSGALGPATLLVTLTIGINDLGWQQALAVCATPGMEAQCAAAVAAMQAAGQQVPARLGAVLGAVRTFAPNATIVVTGYAKLFGADVGKFCAIGNLGGSPVKLPPTLTAMANAALDGAVDANAGPPAEPSPGLNDAIALTTWAFAQQYGNAVFVDVDPAFHTHRLCDTGDRWISGLIRGVPIDRGLHPNAAGMTAFASSILAAMTP